MVVGVTRSDIIVEHEPQSPITAVLDAGEATLLPNSPSFSPPPPPVLALLHPQTGCHIFYRRCRPSLYLSLFLSLVGAKGSRSDSEGCTCATATATTGMGSICVV